MLPALSLNRMVRGVAIVLLLAAAAPRSALAQADNGLWVETAPLDSREQADALLADAGLANTARDAKVLRRFVKGRGWCFILRVGGLEDPAQAQVLASTLASLGARSLVLERTEGQVQTLADLPASPMPPADQDAGGQARLPEGSPDLSDPKPRIQASLGRDTRALLREAAKAHGGLHGGIELVEEATALSLDFERSVAVDDGQLVAVNRYRRLGTAQRLDVEITAGSGTSSTTIITPENRAWVVVDGQPVARDAARTAEILARFAPEAVLAVPLGLARDITEAVAWRDLAAPELVVLNGRDQLRVAGQPGALAVDAEPSAAVATRAADPIEGLVAAWFDAETHRLTQVSWRSAAGVLTFRFSDYAEPVNGLVVPLASSIWRNDRLVEELKIRTIELSPDLSTDFFEDP